MTNMVNRRLKIAKRNVAKRRGHNTYAHLNHRAPSHTLAQAIKGVGIDVKILTKGKSNVKP